MIDIATIFEPATAVAVAVVGWWVKGIKADSRETKDMVRETDKKLDALRSEFHAEMQDYTHKETCRAHREGIQAQINILKEEQTISLAKAVNDTHKMHTLYNSMTQAERKAHAAQCLFRGDME